MLADHVQELGLEYVAPRTLLRRQRHIFIHTMSEMKELIVAIGTNNLGIQLDSWHWFNAEETDKDLALPQYLGALAKYSCDHQFRCGCRGPWRNLFEGDELSSAQKLT